MNQDVYRFRYIFIADLPEDLWRGNSKAIDAYLDIAIYGEGTVGERVVIEDWGCPFEGQWMQRPVWITEQARTAALKRALRDREYELNKPKDE